VATINPRQIIGRWRSGYALDYHTVSSEYLGSDEYGHPVFDTIRTEIGELLYRLKYKSDLSVVAEIVDGVADLFRSWKPGVDLIVPVTPSRARAVQPVVLLAEAISKRFGLTCATHALERVRDVPQLKDVHDFDERTRLLEGAHSVDRRAVEGRHVLLFDDLYRSGATMNEIASTLVDHGRVASISALAITRTRGRR